jgi:glycerophosphoryl diester phosphodiesterase
MYHVGIVFFITLAIVSVMVFLLAFVYFATMKLTMIYESYTEEDEGEYIFPEKRSLKKHYIAALGIVLTILVFAFVSSINFDKVFPSVYATNIIAHRAGGYMANENSLLGLEKSSEKGVRFAEIDVQRTSDGWYVVNHDASFKRNCGVDKTANEMSLDEILELKVRNQFHPTKPSVEVATLDEMLELAHEKNIHLYIELKGKTADKQMAKEVYDIVDSYDMVKDVTFISMKFKTIYYLEKMHPEAETGYLCFYSYGAVRKMKCDALLLESSAAIQTNIRVAHANGKKVYVWTVNSVNGMMNFMTSNVDGIITDEVPLAQSTMKLLEDRNDEARVFQRFLTEWKMSNGER